MGADILSLDENLVFIVRPTAGTQGRLRSDDMWGAAMNSENNTLRQLTEDMAKMKEEMLKVSKLEEDNTQMTLKISQMTLKSSQMTSEISKLREDLAQETAGRLCDMADLNEKIDAEKLRCATKHGNLVQELAAAEEERTAADERLTAAEERLTAAEEKLTATKKELTATKEELQLNIDSVAKSSHPSSFSGLHLYTFASLVVNVLSSTSQSPHGKIFVKVKA
jgi:chromosome segregation ATPase